MIVPEPDLIAIDDELSTVFTGSVRSVSPTSTLSHNDVSSQEPVRCDFTWDLIRGSCNGISGKHVERMRQAKQKAIERKELERKVQFVVKKLPLVINYYMTFNVLACILLSYVIDSFKFLVIS